MRRELVTTPSVRTILLRVVMGALWVQGLAGCGERSGEAGAGKPRAAEPIAVTLAPVERGPIEESVAVTGTLFGEEDTVVSAKLSGRVVSVQKDVGDAAAPGELLAQIERRDYELALDERRAASAAALAKVGLTQVPADNFDEMQLPTVVKARAEASNAEAKFQRAKQLFEQVPPLIAAQDFADIRTAWEVARSQADVELLTNRALLAEARAAAAAEATARQRLADTAVTAPAVEAPAQLRFLVAERSVSMGEFVEPGRAMFRLVAPDQIKYRVRVPERYSAAVRPGQSAQATIDRGASHKTGTVARVSPVVDPQSRTFMVEIVIDNKDGALKPGAFAEGSIILGSRENAMMVPEQAVVTFAGVHRVFSVADGKAVEHRVSLGRGGSTVGRGGGGAGRTDGRVEILGELRADKVIVTGAGTLSAGSPVVVRSE